ncbi:hypothetical protein P4O66_016651 [Electrophorus voltai]|uniref:SH2 domain containing 4A n=1 Tax=Electrophorus voltai TaxID=2609070 RepID=A0AAD8YVG9_9TELE|nr:hypothetical protein P4O66_016651 [Electrophorus voltai]
MLRQILKDMYIEPEVLGALNEEQKRTLFLKMRQEQVRRWKEREEKMEREEPHQPKAKTAHSKNVSWLLGRDGDIQVLVIGESDEFKASKIICSGFGERKSAGLLNHSCNQVSGLKSNLVSSASTEQSGRENLPPETLSGVQLNLKENGEEMRTQPPPQVLVYEQVSVYEPASPVESVSCDSEQQLSSGTPPQISALSTPPPPPPSLGPAANTCLCPYSCTAREKCTALPVFLKRCMSTCVNLSSPHPTTHLQVREAEGAAGLGDGAEHSAPSSIVSYRPHLRAMPKISSVLQSLAPRDRQEKANPLSVTSRLHPNQPPDPNTGKGRDFRVTAASKRSLSVEAESESTVGGDSCSGRGRVAELMKTFSVTCDSTPSQTPPRASKPPVPTKPSHLQLRPSPLLR